MNWQQYWIDGCLILFLGIAAWIDIKMKAVPVAFLMIFGALGLFVNGVWNYQSGWQMMLGCGVGGLFLLIGRLTKEAIGYGDGLGIMILGLFRGLQGVVGLVFCAFLLSGIYGVWKKMMRKASGSDTMPFFPFLFVAALGEIVL